VYFVSLNCGRGCIELKVQTVGISLTLYVNVHYACMFRASNRRTGHAIQLRAILVSVLFGAMLDWILVLHCAWNIRAFVISRIAFVS
jgi:uncharacterized membrane-anchored protein